MGPFGPYVPKAAVMKATIHGGGRHPLAFASLQISSNCVCSKLVILCTALFIPSLLHKKHAVFYSSAILAQFGYIVGNTPD